MILEYLREFNLVSIALRLILALVIGGFIGLERGKQGRAAGMRTHILVCLGATLTVMIGVFSVEVLKFDSDPLRIAAQVVSGIGFLGVGTILVKGRFQITGLTTAAGLWATAAIGLALGAGFFEGALIAFLFTFFTVAIFHKLEYKFNRWNSRFGIYIEIDSDKHVRAIIDYIKEGYNAVDIQITAPRSGKGSNVGIEAIIDRAKNKLQSSEVCREIESLDYVLFAIESI
jgi:putative Mg2+ transporter-C (MgtC) family protein